MASTAILRPSRLAIARSCLLCQRTAGAPIGCGRSDKIAARPRVQKARRRRPYDGVWRSGRPGMAANRRTRHGVPSLGAHRPRARDQAQERRPAHPYSGRVRGGADHDRLEIWIWRRSCARQGRPRSLACGGADRHRHRLHRRRPDFCPPGQRSRPHYGGDRLADDGGRHGLRGRPACSCAVRHRASFRGRLRVPDYRRAAAAFALDAVAPASLL